MEISKLQDCVEKYATENNLVVIDIKCSATNTIEITLDAIEGVSLDKCIELNKHIESNFDREEEDYELTVSSASISEPFKHLVQFQKNIGREIEVLNTESRKITGILEEVTEEGFTIAYTMKVLEEGKKRKVEKEFKDTFKYSEAKKVCLVFKF